MNIYKLENIIQEYSWGSKTAIPELLGYKNQYKKPQAELWMGAHPKAPSKVLVNDKKTVLSDIIKDNPEAVLGESVSKEYGGKLPFLFKILAAEEPLSIQAHPNSNQAKKGFDRENSLGIPLSSPERNYKDPNHKPEIICALSSFKALSGFRKIEDIIADFSAITSKSVKKEISILKEHPDSNGLKLFFNFFINLTGERKNRLISDSVKYAGIQKDERYAWIVKLYNKFPGDVGALCPLLLNYIKLSPGEAMYLSAGELHSYLEGLGIELMANSDNVLRGGLTVKHVDVKELLNTLTFHAGRPDIIRPQQLTGSEEVYKTPAREFRLSRITVSEKTSFFTDKNRAVEMLICVKGNTELRQTGTDRQFKIKKGESVIVPASAEEYTMTGNAVLFKATVPEKNENMG